jgi:SAM-dependent methyltransferase
MNKNLFECPDCHTPIDPATGAAALAGCHQCRSGFLRPDGVLDFVTSGSVADERGFYDRVYKESQDQQNKRPPGAFQALWHGEWAKQDHVVRDAIGDIAGKAVLIVGNGASEKELALLDSKPAIFVYSDLSPIAAYTIQQRVRPHEETEAFFCAIDAHRIPLQQASVDLVYGYAMVHHLPRLEEFLQGVMRVLKPGGKAVFMDDAYAPVWHFSKMTIARPLMWLSHKRTGISPEDFRFSMSGGFREEALGSMIRAVGGTPYFHRVSFFNYLWYRAVIKLMPTSLKPVLTAGVFDKGTANLDRMLLKSSWGARNQIRIVWGLIKPAA